MADSWSEAVNITRKEANKINPSPKVAQEILIKVIIPRTFLLKKVRGYTKSL